VSTVEDRIRERRARLADKVAGTETFPVPGYDGDLWVELRFIPERENDQINQEADSVDAAKVRRLAVACRGLYRSETQSKDDLERIEVDGVPVLFDKLLARRYDFADEITINGEVQPEDVVRALVPDYLRDILHAAYSAWMVSSPEVGADPVGESVPTQPSGEQQN